MANQPTVVADYGCQVAEGPLWHPDEEALYWIDVPAGSLFRYRPATGEHDHVFQTDVIGGFTVQADGDLLLFEDRGTVRALDTDTWETETVVEEIPAETDSRFNDVVADPAGRVFCGTMPTEDRPGRLYRLDTDGTYAVVEDEVAIPNGMGFAPDRESLYLTESDARTIHRYAYDASTGDVSDRETFATTAPDDGIPDGMTVDEAGHVWSAQWNGGVLIRFDPDGEAVDRVSCPAETVSSLAFGGPNYERAYVTTGLGYYERYAKEEVGAGAGALLSVDLGVAGVPEFRSRVRPA